MTIAEIMKRLAGDDYEWALDRPGMAEEMGPADASEVVLTGLDTRDGRLFLFRLHLGERTFKRKVTN